MITESTKNYFRGLSLAAILMASSCAGPGSGPNPGFEDGARNHPISVEPSYQSLKLAYSPADQGLAPQDAAQFQAFVSSYLSHGNGSIAVSAPAGINSSAAITYFAERINQMGVGRDHILVATHDAPNGDFRVELNYVSYVARTTPCGDWSEDLDQTLANDTPKNFGCAVQQNIAAQIADPRDLIGPRPMESANAARRTTVIGKYQAGTVTQADKHSTEAADEQSGTSSEVH